jgi:hypothetical protein
MRKIRTRGCRKMVNAADTLEQARPWAVALVENQERNAGSRMAAYERVASMVGVSPSWLRKLIGRAPEVKEIATHETMNLAAAYSALCLRIEAAAERERQAAAAMRRQADAIVQGDLGVVASAEAARRHGEKVGSGTET